MKQLIACFLVLALSCPQLWADSAPDQVKPDQNQKHAAKIKKKVAGCVERRRQVLIETYDDRRLLGTVIEADAESFVLMSVGRQATFAYTDVKNIKWQSELKRGAKSVAGSVAISAAITGALFGLIYLVSGGLRD